MGCSNNRSIEIPVFAVTNLETRIVVVVSPHTTANDFKREVERAHLNCFPQLGHIKVDAVMVERNSCFYHLPETLPLKHVFQHQKGIKLLRVEACQYSTLYSSEYVDDQICDQYGDDDIRAISGPTKPVTSLTGTNIGKLKCRRNRKKMKGFACLKSALLDVLRAAHFSKKKKKNKKRNIARNSSKFNCLKGPDKHLVVSKARFALPAYGCEGMEDKEQNCSPATVSHCEDISEAVSVSGIIRKHFSGHDDEVNSSSGSFSFEGAQTTLQGEQTRANKTCLLPGSNVKHALSSPIPVKTPPLPSESISRASRNKSKRVEIGTTTTTYPVNSHKRIEIGSRLISASKSIGLMESKNKFSTPRILVPKTAASFIQSLVFERSDEDD